MNQNETVRLFVDSLGNRYVVRIAPMERKGVLGVDWRLNAVVFETDEGEWVGRLTDTQNLGIRYRSRAAESARRLNSRLVRCSFMSS